MDQARILGDAIESLFDELRAKFKEASQQQGALESFRAFLAAVDWREPWLVGLIALQTSLFATAIIFRNNLIVSGVIMSLAACIIYGGERLNYELARHWKQFAKQPYFDKQGIFFGAVISSPLLIMMFILLINFLIKSSSLLVRLKRKELIHKARQRAAGSKEEVQPKKVV